MANVSSRYVSALPGGNRNSDGSFNNAGSNGNWWTATESGSSNAYNRNMNYNNDNVNENNNNKSNGYSVRCVRDCAGEALKGLPFFMFTEPIRPPLRPAIAFVFGHVAVVCGRSAICGITAWLVVFLYYSAVFCEISFRQSL